MQPEEQGVDLSVGGEELSQVAAHRGLGDRAAQLARLDHRHQLGAGELA